MLDCPVRRTRWNFSFGGSLTGSAAKSMVPSVRRRMAGMIFFIGSTILLAVSEMRFHGVKIA